MNSRYFRESSNYLYILQLNIVHYFATFFVFIATKSLTYSLSVINL